VEFCGLAGGAVGRLDDPVEDNGVHDVLGGGDGEAFPHGPQRDLVDYQGVEFLDLLGWPGKLIDLLARLHVAVVSRGGDHVYRRQPVFDDQLTRLAPVGDLVFSR
jgi:hypothetical protein